MTAIIQCENLWKSYSRPARGIKDLLVGRRNKGHSRYAREWALQEVSLEVEKGSAFGIIGHNGTGKSTLLSLILGTIRADRGVINVAGKVASLLELGAGFHSELSGRENIFLYGSILGMSLADLHKNIGAIIDFSELESAIDNPIRTYSDGMIARLGFSTIIHTPADILLIDEVLAVGDSGFKEKCKDFLNNFKKQQGTLVIVSHELEVLEDMCDFGVCLDMGKLVEQGPIDKILKKYGELVQEGRE